MGDSSYVTPNLHSVHDVHKTKALKENHVGQNGTNIDECYVANIEENGTNVDEHYVSNMEEHLPEQLSSKGGVLCSTKSPQQNGYRAEMEESESDSGRLKSQIEFEPGQIDMSSLDKNGSISSSSHEAREDSNGNKSRDCTPLHVNSEEGMQEVTMEETDAQAPVDISHEGLVVNQGRPFSLKGSEGVLMGGTLEDEHVSSSASNVNSLRGDEDVAPCKVLHDNENVEESYVEEKDGEVKETERLDESCTGSSTQPSISTEISSENNVQSPLFNSVDESGLFNSVDESGQHGNEVANEPGEASEAPSLTSNEHNVQNEVNSSKGEWLDQGHGVTMVISNDMEGWQHFDAQEVNTVMGQTQGSDQGLQLWEKLLDDGFDGISDTVVLNPPLQQLAIASSPFEEKNFSPSPFEENTFGLASPGNPFMEGLGRVSSFSEAEGFAQNRDLPSSGRLSQSFEEPSSFQWREGQLQTVTRNNNTSSVLPTVDGETNVVHLDSINEHGSNFDRQLPSSRKPLASFDAIEPFEAPSFMSLVDPKSHALFEASMPTFQARSAGYGQENDGEKWVANFGLMAPSTQEITRSSSMPRSGGESSGRRPGQSFSFATSREPESIKKESDLPQAQRTKSGFLSPKISPLVQKVVDKVRTTPAVANGVLNTVRQVVSPKASDQKSTSKSLFTRCMCW